ncbi:hypothetical protein OU994_00535 [Pseudoduganella sp. SL102]|uniref:DUF6708 domain-containing protein n=1 Tax=Pseudoduganella sp. SL102 TaxID=2995154 RepID=UPI00248BC7F6|nr:DUF6708 domain-containing protein [Pseudoduganella sp. SL102]WBS02825.1 hypothetical protein OU994_00535 [Pseudoduganella sp. SL102]
MDFLGLLRKYPNNRPLSDQEIEHKLTQKIRLNIFPRYQLSVVEMNSTYLESVDKWFGWKGFLTLLAVAIFSIFGGLLGGNLLLDVISYLVSSDAMDDDTKFYLWNDIGMLVVLALPPTILSIWLLKKDSFAFTHYPMRFNRLTRIVHVFRPDGTILSVPWDEIFFTLGHMPFWDDWEVQGHILESDQATVKETFALSYIGSMNKNDRKNIGTEPSPDDYVRAHWEFIRRYMEEGPHAVLDQVQFCMPVNRHHETVRGGFERAFANIAGGNVFICCVMFPFLVVLGICRIFAMRTSKIPEWPAEVQSTSTIHANDPFAIYGAPNGDRVPLFPEAARSAGIEFRRSV